MRKPLIFLTIFSIAIFMFFGCEKNPTESTVNLPEITTADVSAITDKTARNAGVQLYLMAEQLSLLVEYVGAKTKRQRFLITKPAMAQAWAVLRVILLV